MRRSILILLLLLFSAPALAVDGVLEINQTCAVQTGCFAGDTAGLPITITSPGSYRLTSNIIVPDENTDGIVVITSDVGLDLNNFAIIRSGCEGVITNCKPTAGTGSGVRGNMSFYRAISVKNGSITGMGVHGISIGDQAEVTNVRARWNRRAGIDTNNGSVVSGSTAYQNGYGIGAGTGSTVSSNSAYQNDLFGVSCGVCNVFHNTSIRNLGNGFSLGGGSTVIDNVASENMGHGIYTNGLSTISGNTVFENVGIGILTDAEGSTVSGNTVILNGQDGIKASYGAAVYQNNVRRNGQGSEGGYGLNLTGSGEIDTTYRGNTITRNASGAVSGSGVNMGDNYCAGTNVTSTSCP
jgi:parallel beta-helix repeat protein